MTPLVPCSGCQRHVRIDELVCPFCEQALALRALPAQPRVAERLSRRRRRTLGFSAVGILVSCVESNAVYGAPGPTPTPVYGGPPPIGGAASGGAAPSVGGPAQSSGGAVAGGAGGAAGDAGAGGADSGDTACLPVECADLDEDECAAREQGARACIPRRGEPWLEPGTVRYAGCARCSDELPITAEVCAHPPGEPSQCWTFFSGLIPEGWVLLSEVESCSEFPGCGEPD